MKALLSLIVLFTLTSCATKKDELEVQKKADLETNVTDGKAIVQTMQQLIHDSKTLTVAQKTELENIIDANKQKAESLRHESLKFRSLLVKELLAEKVNMKEIKIIKKDIQKIEASRLKNTFDAVEKITTIVSGHPDNHKLAEHILFEPSIR